MKKIILLISKLLICIFISLSISILVLRNDFFKFTQKSKKYESTENFFISSENKDITKIKEDIDKVNAPKLEVPIVPDYNISPKDFFGRNRILMMGDSLVEGMEAYGVLYPSNTIWQRGIRIDNMQEQLEKAVTYNPNAIVLSYGLNDIRLWNGNADRFIDAYNNSLDSIMNALPNTKIYVCSILPVSQVALDKDSSFQYINLFNDRLKQLCNDKGIQFLDSSYLLINASDSYGSDGIHPKAFFYQEWANDIMSKMR